LISLFTDDTPTPVLVDRIFSAGDRAVNTGAVKIIKVISKRNDIIDFYTLQPSKMSGNISQTVLQPRMVYARWPVII